MAKSKDLTFYRSLAFQAQDDGIRFIHSFLEAKEKSMQVSATENDVDKLMDFYADSLLYEHQLSPEKKFSFSGKNDLQRGIVSHLGETKNVKITLRRFMKKQNLIVAEYTLHRIITENGKIENNNILSLIELDNKGKIKRMVNYL